MFYEKNERSDQYEYLGLELQSGLGLSEAGFFSAINQVGSPRQQVETEEQPSLAELAGSFFIRILRRAGRSCSQQKADRQKALLNNIKKQVFVLYARCELQKEINRLNGQLYELNRCDFELSVNEQPLEEKQVADRDENFALMTKHLDKLQESLWVLTPDIAYAEYHAVLPANLNLEQLLQEFEKLQSCLDDLLGDAKNLAEVVIQLRTEQEQQLAMRGLS